MQKDEQQRKELTELGLTLGRQLAKALRDAGFEATLGTPVKDYLGWTVGWIRVDDKPWFDSINIEVKNTGRYSFDQKPALTLKIQGSLGDRKQTLNTKKDNWIALAVDLLRRRADAYKTRENYRTSAEDRLKQGKKDLAEAIKGAGIKRNPFEYDVKSVSEDGGYTLNVDFYSLKLADLVELAELIERIEKRSSRG